MPNELMKSSIAFGQGMCIKKTHIVFVDGRLSPYCEYFVTTGGVITELQYVVLNQESTMCFVQLTFLVFLPQYWPMLNI